MKPLAVCANCILQQILTEHEAAELASDGMDHRLGRSRAVFLGPGKQLSRTRVAGAHLRRFGFLIGLYVFSQGFLELRRKQPIANTPLSKIAAARSAQPRTFVTRPASLVSAFHSYLRYTSA